MVVGNLFLNIVCNIVSCIQYPIYMMMLIYMYLCVLSTI